MVIQANRLPAVFATTGLILFAASLLHHVGRTTNRLRGSFSKLAAYSHGASHGVSRPSFYDIALSHGTDKVTKHHYDYMYQKYLSPYRDRHLKMLEIGLGCDMSYGPGASYWTWLEYFPYIDLYYIEYDADCAEKWARNMTGATIFTGDQADVEFLQRVMTDVSTSFDIIVDDGGHRMEQQIVSLEVLWKSVTPGGIYFCEDLQTSYWENYGGDNSNSGKTKTMMRMVKELLDDLHVEPGGHRRRHEVSLDMQFIDCMEELCAFGKKAA